MELLQQYQNGNTTVRLYKDGTKVRSFTGIAAPEYPESIDIKITNYCDLNCAYCHESSTVAGKHGDLNQLLKTLRDLPAGTELAIGGGNPLSHPLLSIFLHEVRAKGWIANLTINQGHVIKYSDLISSLLLQGLIKGLGISVTSKDYGPLKTLEHLSNNIVYHVIAGVNSPSVLEELSAFGNPKILILGYKSFGRGVNYLSQKTKESILEWYRSLNTVLGKYHLSFDNLAIEQLNVARFFSQRSWDNIYMGDDGMFTMYIDAVEQTFAKTSRSANRVPYTSLKNFRNLTGKL